MLVFAGGIIPDEDIPALKAIGIQAVFQPGTNTDDVVAFIQRRPVPGQAGVSRRKPAGAGRRLEGEDAPGRRPADTRGSSVRSPGSRRWGRSSGSAAAGRLPLSSTLGRPSCGAPARTASPGPPGPVEPGQGRRVEQDVQQRGVGRGAAQGQALGGAGIGVVLGEAAAVGDQQEALAVFHPQAPALGQLQPALAASACRTPRCPTPARRRFPGAAWQGSVPPRGRSPRRAAQQPTPRQRHEDSGAIQDLLNSMDRDGPCPGPGMAARDCATTAPLRSTCTWTSSSPAFGLRGQVHLQHRRRPGGTGCEGARRGRRTRGAWALGGLKIHLGREPAAGGCRSPIGAGGRVAGAAEASPTGAA